MKIIITNLIAGIVLLLGSSYAQWINITPSGNDTTIYGVNMVNSNLVYICRGNQGTVLKSTNGGINWSIVPNPAEQSVNKIQFLNDNTGFIASGSGLYKTTNGGTNWTTLFNTDGFVDICFLNINTGYILSLNSPPKIYRTTNGGLNFSSYTNLQFPAYSGISLSVIDPGIVYMLTYKPAADSSVIFKNTNWDSAWTPIYQTKPMCYDISYIDANTGVICGFSGALKRTSNAGINWANVNPGNTIIFQAVQLVNNTTGYLAGNSGTIFKTTNSGLNWFLQNSQTTFFLNDIHFLLNDSSGFAVGGQGTILKTTNGGLTYSGNGSSVLPEVFMLFQNYPNPFNPAANIKYYLPVKSYVVLNIYDIQGKLVKQLVNGFKHSGYHTEIFTGTGLASGVYFYKIEADGFKEIKKMILAK